MMTEEQYQAAKRRSKMLHSLAAYMLGGVVGIILALMAFYSI